MKLYNINEKIFKEEYLLLAPNDTRAYELADERLLSILKSVKVSSDNTKMNEINALIDNHELRKQQLFIKMLGDDFSTEGVLAIKV